MIIVIANSKGGVGKSFLSFVLGTEVAKRKPNEHVILVDMCPQANLSEIILGGNGAGSDCLQSILGKTDRKTVGGYFDSRIAAPQRKVSRGRERDDLSQCRASETVARDSRFEL